ncbi:MAG: phage portal protein [Alphaproteobacteria bacterium]|nr:phage portal protein [Alphaproteobacteria bacterium]
MWNPFRRKAPEVRAVSLENADIPLSSEAILQILGGPATTVGISVNRQTALDCIPVWAGVDFLCGALGSFPLHVYRKTDDGQEKDRRDPAYSLLHDAPNPEMSSTDWRRWLMSEYLLSGRAMSWIERTPGGRIKAIWPLETAKTTVSRKDRRIRYEYKADSGAGAIYDSAEVIDLVWMRKPDGVGHEDPVHRAREAIGLYLAQQGYAGRTFQKGGVPPLQMVTIAQTEQGVRRASDDVARALAKLAEDGKNVLAMPQGHELKGIGFEPEKMQMESARLFQLGEIARWLGLPKVFLQDLTGATYTNTEQQDLNLVKHRLTDLTTQFEKEMSLKLFPDRRNRRYVEFDMNGLLRGDFKSRMDGYATGVQNGFMTPNEVRHKENLPALPEGDRLYIQGATVPLGTVPAPATAPGDPAPSDPVKKEPNDAEA